MAGDRASLELRRPGGRPFVVAASSRGRETILRQGSRARAGDAKEGAEWLRLLCSVLCLLLAAGCASSPVVHATPANGAPAVVRPAEAPGEALIEITSEPAAAIILVNDQLSGRAPLRLAVTVTPQRFCKDYLTIKARFVATDASQISQTVEVELTPRDKAPTALAFTPQGARRRLP